MNKVYGGSRVDTTAGLCFSCRGALIVKGSRMGDDRAICRNVTPNQPIRCLVTQCSGYDDRREPSRYDYEMVAWWITTSPSRKVGFLSPTDRAFGNQGPPAGPPVTR